MALVRHSQTHSGAPHEHMAQGRCVFTLFVCGACLVWLAAAQASTKHWRRTRKGETEYGGYGVGAKIGPGQKQ
ncbi:hypothetical protein V8C37DRAFT_379613 [Trichoderma ceciliae]